MNYKKDFKMLDNDIIFFDNAATSLKPKQVIKKMNEYYNKYCSNIKRGDYDISYQAELEYEAVRDIIQKLINAKNREEIVFTSGTTDSLNMIVNGFFNDFLEPRDEIIISNSEHASNILPWFDLCQKKDCLIKYITLDKNYEVTLDNLKLAITPNTKVISIAHVTNVVGDLRPLKEIIAYAHSLGIFVVVDGAQSVPHMKVDVQELNPDFLCFSSHKMCGPTGVGVLYAPLVILDKIKPTSLGGGMNEVFNDEKHVVLKETPYRLEAGTPNIANVIGFGEAAKYLLNIGLENIHNYEKKLKKYLIEHLQKIPYVDIINESEESGIVSFNIDGVFAQDVAFYLNKYNICVRAGNHCAKKLKEEIKTANTVRISLYFYNTIEEIDAFLELISDKDKILKEMI